MKLLFTHSSQRDLVRLRDFIAENNPLALVTGDYIVRYAVLEDDIYILRIWHGRKIVKLYMATGTLE